MRCDIERREERIRGFAEPFYFLRTPVFGTLIFDRVSGLIRRMRGLMLFFGIGFRTPVFGTRIWTTNVESSFLSIFIVLSETLVPGSITGVLTEVPHFPSYLLEVISPFGHESGAKTERLEPPPPPHQVATGAQPLLQVQTFEEPPPLVPPHDVSVPPPPVEPPEDQPPPHTDHPPLPGLVGGKTTACGGIRAKYENACVLNRTIPSDPARYFSPFPTNAQFSPSSVVIT